MDEHDQTVGFECLTVLLEYIDLYIRKKAVYMSWMGTCPSMHAGLPLATPLILIILLSKWKCLF